MRLSLRTKLFLFVPVMALVPWLGYQTYDRLTQFAVEAQTQSLQTLAEILHAELETVRIPEPPEGAVLDASPLLRKPTLDGFFDEWPEPTPTLQDDQIALKIGQFDDVLHFGLEVADQLRLYREPQFGRAAPVPYDAISVRQAEGTRTLEFELATEASGRFQARTLGATAPMSRAPIDAFWWEFAGGYRVEWSVPVARLLDAPVELRVVDYTGSTESKAEYQFHVEPLVPAIQTLARRLASDSKQIVVVTDAGQILANTLAVDEHVPLTGGDRTRAGTRILDRDIILNMPVVTEQGHTVHVLLSATRAGVVSRAQDALLNLAWQTLGVLMVLVGGLSLYSSRLTERITRLRNELKRYLNARGRITPSAALSESGSGDEVGVLSRDIQQVLDDLARYTAFLERIPRTLRHELSNPMSAIQSSLELLSDETDPVQQARLRATAERGIQKLESTLSQVTEAASLEEALRADTTRLFDVGALVQTAIDTAKISHPELVWQIDKPEGSLLIAGSDLRFEQLLDKLLDNAVDFTPSGGRIQVILRDQITSVDMVVENQGPPVQHVHETDFFQMFSGSRNDASGSHLGLGLYVVRLIAESMGARPSIENTETGVRVVMTGFRTEVVTQ
jgi:signal transduction histidine kinase